MERRVLLAISLSFLVLFAYQQFVVPPPAPRPASNVTATAQPALEGLSIAPGNRTTAAPILPPTFAEPVIGDTNARDIVVETQKVRAVFTNRGGRLRRWMLKDFRNGRGEPIDLIPETTGPDTPIP